MGNSQSQSMGSGSSSHVPSFVVDSTLDKVLRKRIEETAALARQAILVRRNIDDLQNILDGFSHITEVINLRDMSGFSLLQHAIIVNQIDIVRYLLHQGADVNIPTCARPLHLATKLGRGDIVNLLLEFHADPDVLSCVCYPDSHFASQIVCVPQMDHMHLSCNGDIYNSKSSAKERFEFPRYYAIVANSVECVKIFEKAQHVSSHDANTIPDLHLACKLGSKDCVSYFLQQNKDIVNQQDSTNGYSPIMYALKWDKPLVELLVLNGALITTKTKTKQTLLHLLLKESRNNMFEMLKYLLDCGLRMNVNQLDAGGNSALNILLLSLRDNHHRVTKTFKDISGNAVGIMNKFSKNALSNSSPTLRQMDTGHYEYFTDMEMQYIQCVNLLLKSGLNPNIANRRGNTSLHIIACLPDYIRQLDSNKDCNRYVDLQFIYMLVLAILKAKGNVNITNNSDQSIMAQFVYYHLDDIFSPINNMQLLPLIEHQVEYFLACVKAMVKYGAHLPHPQKCRTSNSICCMHEISDILMEFQTATHYINPDDSEMATSQNSSVRIWASKVLRLLKDILSCFLECGLDPNSCVESGCSVQKHFSLFYYKLVTTEPIVSIQEIENTLKLLVHYGADIDHSGQHILVSVLPPHSSVRYRQLPCYPLFHLINMIGTKSHLAECEQDLLGGYTDIYQDQWLL